MSEDWLARYGLRSEFLELIPELPPLTAAWAPLKIEPIAMSGETLTVAVAVLGEPGTKPRIFSALSSDVTKAVFGEHSDALLGLSRSAANSLYKHLEHSRDFASWVPPFSGVSIGDVEFGQGHSVEEIGHQALRASSCLSTMTEAFRTQSKRAEKNSLAISVKRVMEKTHPSLAERFHVPVPVTIRNTEMTIYCDYFSSRLAINMCSMGPGRNLPQQFEAFVSRLTRLDQLRGNEALIDHMQKPHIIMAVPDSETLETTSDNSNINTFQQKVLMAQDLTEKRDFHLLLVNTPKQGAASIYEMERRAA